MRTVATTSRFTRAALATFETPSARAIVRVIVAIAFAAGVDYSAPLRAADPGKTSGGSGESAAPQGNAVIRLPAYGLLGNKDVQDELGVSTIQREKLRCIAREYETAINSMQAQLPNVPPQEVEKFVKAKDKELRASSRTQVEAILTPTQLTGLKRRILLTVGGFMLDDPNTASILSLTPIQRRACASLERRFSEWVRAQSESQSAKSLALLEVRQAEAARREVLNRYHQTREARSRSAEKATGNMIAVNQLPGSSGSDSERINLPVYEALNSLAIRQKLHFTPTEESKISEISARCVAQQIQAINSAMSQLDLYQKYDGIAIGARSEIEAVLTRDQRAALDDIIVRDNVVALLTSPSIIKQLQFTAGQTAAMAAIRHDTEEAMRQQLKKKEEDKTGQLTPAQLELLQKRVEEFGI
jgi:hypothetical protein